MGKEHSLQIVDRLGNVVMNFDGNNPAPADVNGVMYHNEELVNWPLLAASVDTYIWTPRTGIWVVRGVTSIISVSGGTSATVGVMVCSGLTAVASGVAQLTAALDLEETGPSKQVGTLIATPTRLYPGDSLALDFTGTLTGLVGAITIAMGRVG